MGGIRQKFMHLTNYSVNKKNQAFKSFMNGELNDGQGYKWSLNALRKLFKEQGVDDKPIWKGIEDIVIKTIIGAEPHIFTSFESYVPASTNCFELFGFDVLIDDNLQPHLIEVNLSPSLSCDSPLDQRIKGNLIADLFTLIGVIPLEQRKVGQGEQKYSKLSGLYNNGVLAPSHTVTKRSAISVGPYGGAPSKPGLAPLKSDTLKKVPKKSNSR